MDKRNTGENGGIQYQKSLSSPIDICKYIMNRCVEEPNIPYGEDLSQDEADRLLRLEKTRTTEELYIYPSGGEHLELPVSSIDLTEDFIISVVPGKIDIMSARNQLRCKRGNIILARLDVGGRPHRNPDDTVVESPHIHVFKEGYGVRYAYPVDEKQFPHLDDPYQLLLDFLTYCNVTKRPHITRGADQW